MPWLRKYSSKGNTQHTQKRGTTHNAQITCTFYAYNTRSYVCRRRLLRVTSHFLATFACALVTNAYAPQKHANLCTGARTKHRCERRSRFISPPSLCCRHSSFRKPPARTETERDACLCPTTLGSRHPLHHHHTTTTTIAHILCK